MQSWLCTMICIWWKLSSQEEHYHVKVREETVLPGKILDDVYFLVTNNKILLQSLSPKNMLKKDGATSVLGINPEILIEQEIIKSLNKQLNI